MLIMIILLMIGMLFAMVYKVSKRIYFNHIESPPRCRGGFDSNKYNYFLSLEDEFYSKQYKRYMIVGAIISICAFSTFECILFGMNWCWYFYWIIFGVIGAILGLMIASWTAGSKARHIAYCK